jgi:hypothetical protein
MQAVWLKSGLLGAMISLLSIGTIFGQNSATFDVHDRVGDGWHMYSTVTLDPSGMIHGVTTLKNYNNFKGYTGGIFVVALDIGNEAIYATEVRKYGINGSFFKKKRVRTETWSDRIPEEYLPHIAKLAVIQMHTPTNRVWKWIYANKDLLIQHAYSVADVIKDIQNDEFDVDDAFEIIKDHLN